MTDRVQQLPGTTRKVSRMSHDWEEIERDYRVGVKSISQIAREQDISRAAIHRRAKRLGWERDLSVQVQQRAKAKLAREATLEAQREIGRAVSPSAEPEGAREGAASPDSSNGPDDRELVELNADAIVHVVRGHRQDLIRLRRTLSRLHAPLEAYLDSLAAATETDSAPEHSPALLRVLGPRESLGDLTIKLSRALSTLIPLERKAFGIDEGHGSMSDDQETLDEQDRAILADYRAAVAREIMQELAPD